VDPGGIRMSSSVLGGKFVSGSSLLSEPPFGPSEISVTLGQPYFVFQLKTWVPFQVYKNSSCAFDTSPL